MNRFDERYDSWVSYFSEVNVEAIVFIHFVRNELTSLQCKESLEIERPDDFLQYLLCAFGCHQISRNYGVPHLIRNPEALSLTAEQKKQLLDLLRETITTELETTKIKKAAIKSQKK